MDCRARFDGASSMGGLIKYVTKQPDSGRLGVDARIGMSDTQGGGVSYNGAAAFNSPIVDDKVAVRASGFYSHDGGFVDNLALNRDDVDRSNVKGGRLDLLFTPTDALSIRLTGFLQDIDRDGQRGDRLYLRGSADGWSLRSAAHAGRILRSAFPARQCNGDL